MRRGALVALLALWPTLTRAEPILGAQYAAPTDRYPHGALGDDLEWGALVLTLDGRQRRFTLPDELVFEDTAPRLADLDGDGAPEVIVVESHAAQGARLAVWGAGGRLAATPFIGTRFRWLAPLGAADLDGDGRVEIAYVETPHLGRVLRLARLEGGWLVPLADLPGLTNHSFGDPQIQGGIALCPGGAVIVTADADWRRVLHTRWQDGRLRAEDAGRYTGPASLVPDRACEE
ncbi:FG-GAP repeat domain-containing protein [Frigidibacter mobilis]|uniref:FG-GAP repeat-containing protein n=1 Tax=Frigidibacter mobilis TaxID=1335048 RepID=A0A159Z674_9RHOB|nr:VCBS repeat-containing protein [Frigidibacter mobilis]AMY69968.1 FG-GAP repeat-containing protein [Frigidibacter mobilis]